MTHMTHTAVDEFVRAVARTERTFRTPLLEGAVSVPDVIVRIERFESRFRRAPQALVALRALGWKAREEEIRAEGLVLR